MSFLLGSGAGFSGDRTDAAIAVVAELARRGEPCALVFETLGERTLAGAHRRLRDDPEGGYEPLIEELLEPVLATCQDNGIAILGNFGAADPASACCRVHTLARRLELGALEVAEVFGDDVRDRLEALDLTRWEAESRDLPEAGALVSANVYLGAAPLVEALELGAEVVVAGRVADPALFLAPLIKHFGWSWDDWDLLAAGTMAGHLGECGSQVSGGYFADPGFKDVPDMARLGYPIIEVEADGTLVVTKPPGTGGLVTIETVKEQLLYEVHDPSAYLTPDVVVDLTSVRLEQVGIDRVAVTGIRGKPAPDRLKTTVCHDAGWQGEAEISYAGPNALERARLAADVLRERLSFRAPPDLKARFDIIGHLSVFNDDAGQLTGSGNRDGDYRLRLAVEHPKKRWVERATQELLALYCAGPAGGGGVRRQFQRRLLSSSYLVRREDIVAGARLKSATRGEPA
ncbi:DUF1446 domain-containing protein [Halomonas sp. H33-56]|uniref:acyclic terpene utilization AtuA family protein n=1 Tax=unclassified Halomonas TaxID=2609666 RepID=UPI000F5ECF0C|nr:MULTISPECIES: acyclic terpene utilization AtuA family protein [unclassified Halomonas]MBY5941724.1 DUF1446 domain-containing protein [Halomonas sp. DP5N14-9]MBY6109033.1 DUF1446 domain-containing protein [Halomonas sp. DP1Y21-3]RQW72675.1 DUF1446 domain-containing protein [Halomonas sp. YLB-10]